MSKWTLKGNPPKAVTEIAGTSIVLSMEKDLVISVRHPDGKFVSVPIQPDIVKAVIIGRR